MVSGKTKSKRINMVMHKSYLYQWVNFDEDFGKASALKRFGASGPTANSLLTIDRSAKQNPQIAHWVVAARRKDGKWRVSALLKARASTLEEEQTIGKYDRYLYFDINEESGYLALPGEEPIFDSHISDAIDSVVSLNTRGENGTQFFVSEESILRLRKSIKLSLSARLAQLESGISDEKDTSPSVFVSVNETAKKNQEDAASSIPDDLIDATHTDDIDDAYPSDGSTNGSYESDPAIRAAVERHAMFTAERYYQGLGFAVQVLGKPYDLKCVKEDLCIHVEVKGTRGDGKYVILTRNEKKDARDPTWRSDLYVLSEMILEIVDDKWVGKEGKTKIIENWIPHDDDLTPTQFEYRVP